jgi:hypothetical protein
MVFHETVPKELVKYMKKWDLLEGRTLLEEEVLNAHRLAQALHHQFIFVRWSLRLLILGLVLLVFLLVLALQLSL